jgi:hypothetical protein
MMMCVSLTAAGKLLVVITEVRVAERVAAERVADRERERSLRFPRHF